MANQRSLKCEPVHTSAGLRHLSQSAARTTDEENLERRATDRLDDTTEGNGIVGRM